MVTVHDKIDSLEDNNYTIDSINVDESGTIYTIYYTDTNGTTHRLTLNVSVEDIIKETDELL